jgi:hypothetical protein
MRKLVSAFVLVFCAVGAASGWAASPCDGVDRNLASERKAELAPGIAKELKVKKVMVLDSFQFGGWSIIYVGTFETDEVFLFYANDPLKNSSVTTWGGVALKSEEQEIRDWTIKNAPGIPLKLANCFAWHVTRDSR